MGMSIFEFEYMTPREYQNKVRGHIERVQEIEVSDWARTRQLGYYIVSTMKLKRKLKSPKDLFSLPIDEQKKKPKEALKPMTREEALKLSERWAKG